MTPTEMLAQANQKYPQAWKDADMFRADRGKDLPDWPNEVFLPIAGWYAITCDCLGVDRLALQDIQTMQILSCVGTWRPTQDIVRFDPDLYESLKNSPVEGSIPVSILKQLPAWCIYIELGNEKFIDSCTSGVFVLLEKDANTGVEELRLNYMCGDTLSVVALELGDGDINAAIERSVNTTKTHGKNLDISADYDLYQKKLSSSQTLHETISMVLYLCVYGFSDGILQRPASAPSRPAPKKTKHGWRLFPPDKPKIWTIGTEIGQQIREYAKRENAPGTHPSPRPHIRRGHWHKFWTGTKVVKEGVEPIPRKLEARWLPAFPVALREDE